MRFKVRPHFLQTLERALLAFVGVIQRAAVAGQFPDLLWVKGRERRNLQPKRLAFVTQDLRAPDGVPRDGIGQVVWHAGRHLVNQRVELKLEHVLRRVDDFHAFSRMRTREPQTPRGLEAPGRRTNFSGGTRLGREVSTGDKPEPW